MDYAADNKKYLQRQNMLEAGKLFDMDTGGVTRSDNVNQLITMRKLGALFLIISME